MPVGKLYNLSASFAEAAGPYESSMLINLNDRHATESGTIVAAIAIR
jgi:hypothetical protein